MATCVDLAGATYPNEHDGQPIQPLEGKSLAPAFAGKPIERDADLLGARGQPRRAAGNWKLVAKGPAGRGNSTTSSATAPSCTTSPPASRSASANDRANGKPGPSAPARSPGSGSRLRQVERNSIRSKYHCPRRTEFIPFPATARSCWNDFCRSQVSRMLAYFSITSRG